MLLPQRQELVVDRAVANAVRERIDAGADQPLAVFEIEHMRGDAEALLVRLVDDRSVEVRRELLELAVAGVDPDLDDVDLLVGEVLNRLAAVRLARDPVRRRDASRLGHGDAASGAEVTRRARNDLAADIEQLVRVETHAQHRADAVIAAHLQVADQPVADRAEMHMRVDDRRHDGLAGEVHARGAGRHGHALAGLDDLVAVDDERRVLDDVAVTDNEPHAFERRDVRAHRTAKAASAAIAATATDIQSTHRSLPRTVERVSSAYAACLAICFFSRE